MLTNKQILTLAVCLLPHMASADPNLVRQQELTHLLKQDCGSCHGMTLKGGLGTPLTPDVLADRPDELLYVTIMQGRPGTPMPPWQGILSQEDTRWLIKLLRRGLTNDTGSHPK